MLTPEQGRQVLATVTYAGTITSQCDYPVRILRNHVYAALRPCEVTSSVKLPETGWGELILEKWTHQVADVVALGGFAKHRDEIRQCQRLAEHLSTKPRTRVALARTSDVPLTSSDCRVSAE